MGFFTALRSSLFDPQFYAGMRERSWTEAARYYAVIAFVVIFSLLSPVWVLLLNVRPETIDMVTAIYPDPLEVTVANGVMSTNQPQPYAIKNNLIQEIPENFAVFSTDDDVYTPTSIEDAHTVILFKRSFAVTKDQGGVSGTGEQRLFPYGTSTGTTTLTKSDITTVAEKIKPYVRPVAIVGGAFLFVLAVLIGGTFMLVFHLLYTFLAALLVYVYFKLRKRNETYRTAYTTALFATLPVSILAAFAILFGGLPTLAYTLLVLIIVIVNDSRLNSTTLK